MRLLKRILRKSLSSTPRQTKKRKDRKLKQSFNSSPLRYMPGDHSFVYYRWKQFSNYKWSPRRVLLPFRQLSLFRFHIGQDIRGFSDVFGRGSLVCDLSPIEVPNSFQEKNCHSQCYVGGVNVLHHEFESGFWKTSRFER